MTLSLGFEQQVEARLRRRGEDDYRRGAVRLLVGTSARVTAQVTGTRRYQVTLHVPSDRTVLRTHCTCPHFDTYGVCKHLWATLLAAEREALLGRLDLSGRPVLVEDDALAPTDEHLFDGDAVDSALPADGRGGRGRPSWLDDLVALNATRDDARSPARPRPERRGAPEEQLLYVLDFGSALVRSELRLALWTRRARPAGGFSRPRAVRAQRQSLDRWAPLDRHVLALVLGGAAESETGTARFHGGTSFYLQEASLATILPLLGRSGRLFMSSSSDDALGEAFTPLAIDDGPPWQLILRVRACGASWRLSGVLARGAEEIAIEAPSCFLRAGWLLFGARLAPLASPEHIDRIALLRQRGPLDVPREQADRLLEAVHAIPSRPIVELPDELRVERVAGRPTPILRVFQPEQGGWQRERLFLEPRFGYGELDIAPGSALEEVFDASARQLISRDVPAERAALARLVEHGARELPAHLLRAGDSSPTFAIPPRELPGLVQALLLDGWRVEANGRHYRPARTLSLRVESGVDWFDLQGEADFDGQVLPAPKILAAIRRGEREIVLDDGTIGMLPEAWLHRLGLLGASATLSPGSARFRRSQLALLDALLEAHEGVAWDDRAERARAALVEFKRAVPLGPPPSFTGVLRPYQRDALGWFESLRQHGLGGCLADDMGLGKTVQALALFEQRRVSFEAAGAKRTSLVVAPRSVVFNWREEAARFAPRLRVFEHSGASRQTQADALAPFDLILTTYGVLRRDIAMLRELVFDYVVLDEAQAIKNARSQAAKAARLLQADHRLALSGTPIENHLGELFSLFEFLNPGMLGGVRVFKALESAGTGRDAALERLARATRPVILRRTKAEVATDLPPKTEQTLYCELEGEEARRYEQIRSHYRARVLGTLDDLALRRSKLQVLEALLRLRQAACHPGLLDKQLRGHSSAKTDLLLAKLEEVLEEGHKALVFSQFTQLLALVRAKLDQRQLAYEYLDGRTRNRAERVRRFQQDAHCKIFLISLKAGGLGLNLTAADYVFLLDPWWNPAVEAQAIDRAHRIGQTEHVFAYRLIAKDTIEEKVLELQRSKRELADAILQGDGRSLADLTREDLELLFS